MARLSPGIRFIERERRGHYVQTVGEQAVWQRHFLYPEYYSKGKCRGNLHVLPIQTNDRIDESLL
jgi:hypothetical protein